MLIQRNGRLPASDVLISLEGRCICPTHGEMGPDVEYMPGVAPCGCFWEAMPGGFLRVANIHNIYSVNNDVRKAATEGLTARENFA
jgi:hypothetical protein